MASVAGGIGGPNQGTFLVSTRELKCPRQCREGVGPVLSQLLHGEVLAGRDMPVEELGQTIVRGTGMLELAGNDDRVLGRKIAADRA
ncbi:hypothetical protein [Streptomyces phaeochromogenes]